MAPKWIPLESNPDVLNAYATKLGADLSEHSFCDVFGLDEEMLSMVPQPVQALILCFPVTQVTDAVAKSEDEAAEASPASAVSQSAYFMKQTIGNACGTIALLHTIANLPSLKIAPNSFLEEFLAATRGMSPEARGQYLESPPEGARSIEEAHQAAASEGDTAAPGADEEVDLHFVAFVAHEGRLLQLDGRRRSAVDCGPTSKETLLQDTATVVKRFVELTNSVSFNLMALAAAA